MEAVGVKLQDERVQTINYTVTRIIVSSDKPFEEVTNAIESLVGDGKYSIFEVLNLLRPPFEQVKTVIESMEGSSGFMKLASFEMGDLMSLMGRPKKIKLYLIGNPLIATQMIEHNPVVGLYVPPRVLVYEDYEEGKTYIAYEQPSSMLSQFENTFILKVAQALDEKFKAMVFASV